MKEKTLKKIDELISECQTILELAQKQDKNPFNQDEGSSTAKYKAFKTSVLSFLAIIVGKDHIYYKHFDGFVIYFKGYNLSVALELLQKIRADVDQGWMQDIKGIISAEIFSDFLEMAEHLLTENYKDPAAVIIGSVLEENLRELCTRNGIPISTPDPKTGNLKPHKADTMNADLAKKGIYNLLVQKSITAWLDLRNKAAHGKYLEYDINQVRHFLEYVTEFASKYL